MSKGYVVFEVDKASDDAIIAQAKKILQARLFREEKILGSTEDLKDLLSLEYSEAHDEMFGAVMLDSNYKFLGIQEIFKGTINTVQIHTRPIVRATLDVNASFVVLFHNHPSGNSVASQSDIEQTTLIADALKCIDVKVLDHIIVAKTNVSSFMEQVLEI